MSSSTWQTNAVLAKHALATIENGCIMHYGDPINELKTTANSNTLFDLSHLGLLEITGDDAVSFLQGQVTNDVKLLLGNNAHYSGYCNPKGRLLALFLAFFHYDHLHLQFNRQLVEPILKRLKMYVMRSKVKIKDVSDTIVKIGINGPNAIELLTPLFATLPIDDYELVSLTNGAILKLPTLNNHARFQLFMDNIQAEQVINALKESCQLAGKPCWDWLDIQMGIPDVTLKTQEQFVPQMLNLDILGAINFKKGCYTGQEIVARTHYLGTVKRRMYLGNLDNISQPQIGDKVFNIEGIEVGQVTRQALNLVGDYDVLAELRIEAVNAGTLICNDSHLLLKDLPYAIDKI